MKFSIIVPIYKVEEYLKQCVDSILHQTYRDLEIILVDDGSPDGCPAICDAYAAQDARVKVIHKANGGLVSARQAGLKVATGDYIGFVDGDDWIDETMYQAIAEELERSQTDIAIVQFYFAFADRNEKSRYQLTQPYYDREAIVGDIVPNMLFSGQYYQFGIYPNCWSKVVRKNIIEHYLYDVDTRLRLGEDIAFTYGCIMEAQSLSFIDKPLYYYRINTESMTKKYDPVLQNIYMLPYEAIERQSERNQFDLSEQLPYYLLYIVNYVIRNEASAANDKSANEKREVLRQIVGNTVLQRDLKRINTRLLPLHTRLMYASLKSRSLLLLRSYMKLLRRFL